MQRIFVALLALTTWIAFCGVPSAAAQNAGSGFPPDLAAAANKYQSAVDALAAERTKTVAQMRQPYLTALAATAQRATSENKPDEAKAMADETAAVTAGGVLPAQPSPLLPRTLYTLRGSYLREVARVEREYNLHVQQAASEYLRGLAFYESRAQAAGQADLLKQIAAEKVRLSIQAPAAVHPGHSATQAVVLNGDFSQKKPDGTPESWKGGGPGKGAVATEQDVTFLRLASTGKQETWFIEELDRPANVKELQVSVRLRSKDFKGAGPYGIVIAQRDAANGLVSRDQPCVLKAPCPTWKTLNGMVQIHPETTKLIIRCNMVDCSATVDFADLHVDGR